MTPYTGWPSETVEGRQNWLHVNDTDFVSILTESKRGKLFLQGNQENMSV